MPRKAKQPVVSDDDDEFIHDGDEDEEEDFEEDELVVKKKKGKRRSGRSTRRSRRAKDSDSDEAMPKRRPRAASLKKPKYSKWLRVVLSVGLFTFYRTMHFSAFARSWDRMSSVCPFVRL